MSFSSNPNLLERVLQRISSIDQRIDSISGTKNETNPSSKTQFEDNNSASFQNVLSQLRGNLTPRASKWVVEDAIQKAGISTGIDTDLIKSIVNAESGGDSNAISSAGAKGLMQLMDSTANDLGVKDPFDPHQNALGGASYLKQQLERFDGNLLHALAAYNAGPQAVEENNGIPPYKETIDYVKKVESNYRKLKNKV
ncbi:MAG: lytic transglycosylase domain-containing protein [Candidatus Caenarcaniphilales bacterium]|nr:lytic transglycosylase domain-containing protein [Candidatus Caenarcaniphilales bacterium]